MRRHSATGYKRQRQRPVSYWRQRAPPPDLRQFRAGLFADSLLIMCRPWWHLYTKRRTNHRTDSFA